jgi:hypothetical protein
MFRFYGLILILAAISAAAQRSALLPSPHLGDYDAELRQADGRVDCRAMVQRLRELRITRYYWLVWHASTDWEDLKKFLPEAAQAQIQVWVYLVPPSEGPPGGYPASEPFKLDYMRWAEEIARLSLQHTNLRGWVIDDFYANRQLFTPDYVRQMQRTAKAINSQLLFLPLMYFPEITPRFVEDYQGAIDGVVVAYPQDREEIVHSRAILSGETLTMPGLLSCPWNTVTRAGDFVSASILARVVSTNRVRLGFRELDDFDGPTAGYHFKQASVDGVKVWEEDVAGGRKGWQDIDVDLTTPMKGKTNVIVTFRLVDKKG